MPTYEYVCDACEHQFEDIQGFNDKPHKKCPQCKKMKLRRLFGTGGGIIFKGTGFTGKFSKHINKDKADAMKQVDIINKRMNNKEDKK